MNDNVEKVIIGRAEVIRFPDFGKSSLHARIDTGAKTSSIWASELSETQDGLMVRFASPTHDIYQFRKVFKHYDRVAVASSNGHVQLRYRVKLPIIIKKRRILATFTLADRSTQVYPVLIGRATLNGKFVVDVQKGTPLWAEENQRSTELQKHITEEHI